MIAHRGRLARDWGSGGLIALAELGAGQPAVVEGVDAHGLMQRRLLDLGFVPGTPVELDQQAPFGDLRAYRIRGSVFALRAAESWSVKVRPAEPGDETR